jgi:hypothetical protein
MRIAEFIEYCEIESIISLIRNPQSAIRNPQSAIRNSTRDLV